MLINTLQLVLNIDFFFFKDGNCTTLKNPTFYILAFQIFFYQNISIKILLKSQFSLFQFALSIKNEFNTLGLAGAGGVLYDTDGNKMKER